MLLLRKTTGYLGVRFTDFYQFGERKHLEKMEEVISCTAGLACISRIEFSASSMSYATNSIYLRFFDSTGQEVGYFMINPSWRIISGKKMLQSSDVYPFHNQFDEGEADKESQEFHRWCNKTEDLRNQTVKNICIAESGDLEITWENETKLQLFILDDTDYTYYYYDILSELMYEFSFEKCVREKYQRKKK